MTVVSRLSLKLFASFINAKFTKKKNTKNVNKERETSVKQDATSYPTRVTTHQLT